MDKGERGKRSSPRSGSRRTYGLFSSIINLSSSSGVRPDSSRESPVDSPPSNPKLSDVPTTKKKKKTRGNQSPSSCSSISSTGIGGMTVPAPIGPAPRTFSILTALNELAVSDQGTRIPKSFRRSPPLPDPTDPCSSISSGNSSSNNGTFQHSLSEAGKLRDRRKGTSTSQKSRESERAARHERSKSKERTPEWIWKLFLLAKDGRLPELQQSLKGLDSTLIRHLADATGSTLLHCASRGGHLSTLQWLVSILGPHSEAAVNDRNRAGRSVILTALKEGQLECFQWLVLNTRTGDTALVPNDGERSLLHYAASYGDLAAVRWLAHILHDRGLQVDLKDSSGRTPLHMSAKAGYISVCHELILAGSDPLHQSGLGWRPADLAVRHRRMECVNYFMMAETAASVGNELDVLFKDFQAVQEERESLRSHFRELLRVGKWLVKERTDLIKNFGSKSSAEGSMLLGEVNNGSRFSELEHKLVQAEQAWKHLQMSPKSDVGETSENDNSYHFQRSLAAAQSRCDKNIALRASSSTEEEESCLSGTSSSEEDNARDHPIYPLTNTTPDPYRPITSSKSSKSTIAPWLLPPNDAFLAQLSPFVNQRDVIGTTPTAPPTSLFSNQPSNSSEEPRNTVHSVADQSLMSSSTSFYETTQVKSSSNVEATVLEVIEPTSLPIKKGEDGMDRSRVSVYPSPWLGGSNGKHQCKLFESLLLKSCPSPSSGVGYKGDPMSSIVFHPGPSHSLSNPIDNESVTKIRRVAKVNRRREATGSLMSLSGAISSSKEEPEGPRSDSTHDLIRAIKCGNNAENLDGKWLECQGGPRLDETIYSEIKGPSYSSATSIKSHAPFNDELPPPDFQKHKKQHFPLTKKQQRELESSEFNEADHHLDSFSTSVQFLKQEKSLEEVLSKSFPNTSQPSNLVTNESLVLTNVGSNTSQSQRTRSGTLTVLPIIDSSPKSTFPILTSIEFSSQQLESTGSQEEISCGPSGQIPPESVSTSNTPVMRRSYSSMSRCSSTVLFPSRKGSWVSPEFLSSMTTESSLTGRLSPSPSEASRTESALAPPPSNASHTSHNSEASKTESARGVAPDPTRNIRHPEFGEDAATRSACECSSPESDDDDSRSKNTEKPTARTPYPGEIRRKDRDNEDDESRISSLATLPSQNIQAAPCLSMRPLVSSGIHEATIQRVTKSGRGQPKPWYEIEGSDDEGSLLRKARSRSSRSSKLSTSSLSDSESQNESETSDEHVCDPSCPRHNCPDFV